MRDRWVGKNVNLEVLVELLKQFFEEKRFKVVIEKQSTNYRIFAFPTTKHSICDPLEIVVRGEPNDFMVEFGVAAAHTKTITILGGLTYLLGGGYFLRKGLKSQEEINKLERDFWNFIDMKLPSLEGKRI